MSEMGSAIAGSSQMGRRGVKRGMEEGPVCVEYMIVDSRGVAFNLDMDSWIAGRGVLEPGGHWEAGVQGSVPVGAFDRVHGSTVWVSAVRGDAGRWETLNSLQMFYAMEDINPGWGLWCFEGAGEGADERHFSIPVSVRHVEDDWNRSRRRREWWARGVAIALGFRGVLAPGLSREFSRRVVQFALGSDGMVMLGSGWRLFIWDKMGREEVVQEWARSHTLC